MLSLIFWAALAGAAAFLAFHAYGLYQAATGTWYARVLSATRATFTWAWAGILLAIGQVLDLANVLAGMVDLPSVQDNIQKLSPKYIAIAGAAFLVIRIMAAIASVVRPWFRHQPPADQPEPAA